MISIERLWREAEGACWYCGKQTWLARTGWSIGQIRIELLQGMGGRISMGKLKAMLERRRATREHLRRRADNGSNMRWNIVLACQHCNSSRGDRTPEEHQLHIREGIAA